MGHRSECVLGAHYGPCLQILLSPSIQEWCSWCRSSHVSWPDASTPSPPPTSKSRHDSKIHAYLLSDHANVPSITFTPRNEIHTLSHAPSTSDFQTPSCPQLHGEHRGEQLQKQMMYSSTVSIPPHCRTDGTLDSGQPRFCSSPCCSRAMALTSCLSL